MIGEPEVRMLRWALESGGVALVPTDTVYGIAAALDSVAGVERLYAVKGRPRSQPCQVLVYSERVLAAVIAGLDPRTAAGVRALLPGPATCVVADPAGRFAAASGDRPGSVGIRAPRLTPPIAPLGDLDLPLVATSANDPGGRDPRTLDDVPGALRAAVDVELDGGALPGTASAVVDLRGAPHGEAALLRPGPDPEAVERALAILGIRLVSDTRS